MKITLIKNLSPSNYIYKDLSDVIELEGTLRNGTSLLYPSITLEIPEITYNGLVYNDNGDFNEIDDIVYADKFLDNLLTCNYAYIDDFKRYYYIENIQVITNKLVTIDLRRDVLESFKIDLMNLKGFVSRNEYLYNEYVKDDNISFYYDKEVIDYIPDNDDKVNTAFNTELTLVANNYILTVITKDVETPTDYVNSPSSDLPRVFETVTGARVTARSYVTYPTQIRNLEKYIINDDTKNDYILSCVVYPFTFSQVGADHYLKLGDEQLIGVQVGDLDKEMSDYLVIADFTIKANSFLDYEPYTQYEIWLPYLSWTSLSADDILNNRIIVYYIVDYRTGNAQVSIYDVTNDKTLFTSNCQIGVQLAFTKTTAREVSDANNANNIGLGVGLLSSALSVAAGVATYNPVAIGAGVISAGSTVAKYMQNQNTNYVRASGALSSGYQGLYQPQAVHIKKTRLKPKGYDSDYFKLHGRPLNEYVKLNDLSGYTEVGEIFLENIVNATKGELDEIKALLLNGVVINK